MNDQIDTGMELRDLLADAEFAERARKTRNPKRESAALRRLARVFADKPEVVLQELVDIAVEFCGADSAGISLEELDAADGPRFRWVAISGSFAQYLQGTTPRFFSPCGTCLNSGRAQLYRVTKPYYDFLGVTAEPITDGMLIPWVSEKMRGTIWAVAHQHRETFDPDDYELLNTLAEFVSIAVRHQAQEKVLRQQAQEQARAVLTNELAHKINNPLQSLTNTVFLAGKGDTESQAHLQQAAKELSSLSELVRKLLAGNGLANPSSRPDPSRVTNAPER
jgi:GAF domain-containing protein